MKKEVSMKKSRGGFYYGEGYSDLRESVGNARGEDFSDLEEKVGKLGAMSADRLLEELFSNAAAARRRGELDDEKLENFYNSVKGMLTPDQLKRLDVLMHVLRGDNML